MIDDGRIGIVVREGMGSAFVIGLAGGFLAGLVGVVWIGVG